MKKKKSLSPSVRYYLAKLKLPQLLRFIVKILKKLAARRYSFVQLYRLLFLTVLFLIFLSCKTFHTEKSDFDRLTVYPVGKVLLTNPISQRTRIILGYGFLFFTNKPLNESVIHESSSWELFFTPRSFRVEAVVDSSKNDTECDISLYRMHCSTPWGESKLCQVVDSPLTHVAAEIPEYQSKAFMREVVACNTEPLTSATDGRFMMTYLELALQIQIDRIVFHERESDPMPKALVDLLAAYKDEHLVAVEPAFEVSNDDPIFGKHAGWMEHTANVNLCYNKYRFSSEFIIFPEGYELPLPRFTGPWSRPLAVFLRQEASYRRFTTSLYIPRVKASVNVSSEENAITTLKKASVTHEKGDGLLVAISIETLGVTNNIAVPDRHFDAGQIYHTVNHVLYVNSSRMTAAEFVDHQDFAVRKKSKKSTTVSFENYFENINLEQIEKRNHYFLMFKKNVTDALEKLADFKKSTFEKQQCQATSRTLRRFVQPQSKTCFRLPSCHNLTVSETNVKTRYFGKGVFARLKYVNVPEENNSTNTNQTFAEQISADPTDLQKDKSSAKEVESNVANLQQDRITELEKFRVNNTQNNEKLQSQKVKKGRIADTNMGVKPAN